MPLGSCPYNANLAEQIIGFEFDIKGDFTGDELRIVFDETDVESDAYEQVGILYLSNVDITTFRVFFSDAEVWWDETSDKHTIPATVTKVQFQIAADGCDPRTFDITVTGARAITAQK